MSTPTDPDSSPAAYQHHHQRQRSHSRSRGGSPPPRPVTPLRPPSRSSLRSSHTPTTLHAHPANPINALEPAFAELADSMADLEANFVHLQLMHESLNRFNECFASFLYGLNVNAFCVDFPEGPIAESFRRAASNPGFQQYQQQHHAGEMDDLDGTTRARMNNGDVDQTFLTTDTSFVENPPVSSVKAPSTRDTSRLSTPGRKTTAPPAARGGRGASGIARGATAGGRTRPSGLARATTRGRGGSTR